MSPGGNTQMTIENTTADKISPFAWSPDGKRLAFPRTRPKAMQCLCSNRQTRPMERRRLVSADLR